MVQKEVGVLPGSEAHIWKVLWLDGLMEERRGKLA